MISIPLSLMLSIKVIFQADNQMVAATVVIEITITTMEKCSKESVIILERRVTEKQSALTKSRRFMVMISLGT